MRKLVVLLFAAAVIGVVISKVRGDADEAPQVAQGEGEAAEVVVARPAPPSGPKSEPVPAVHQAAPLNARRSVRTPRVVPVEAVAVERPREQPRPAPVVAVDPQPVAEPGPVRVRKIETASAATTPARVQGSSAVAGAIARASSLVKEGRRVEARKILSDLYLQSRGADVRRLRVMLDEISSELVFNPRCTEGAKIHVVQPGETLGKIGKAYGQSWQMVQRVNGMTHDRINIGQQLKILDGEVGALVVLSEFRLTMLIDGVYAKEYPIGIGLDDKTPPGEFVVDTMLVKPRWYKPGGGVVEYGEEGHLLGERWIGFEDQPGAAGLGIHGTNDESTIGTKCSNGCLRMRRDDVIELYDFMKRGSKVVVRP